MDHSQLHNNSGSHPALYKVALLYACGILDACIVKFQGDFILPLTFEWDVLKIFNGPSCSHHIGYAYNKLTQNE